MYNFRKYDPKIEAQQEWWNRTKQWKSVYHETGHVWFADRSGWPVKFVTIDPKVHKNPNANGLTELHSFPVPIPSLILNYAMAGKVCERLVLPNGLWGLSEMGGFGSDEEKAIDYLKDECGVTSSRQQKKLLREAEAEVRALVTDPTPRDEIDHLAEALMNERTLTGDQVRAIIKGHDYAL